MFGSEILEVAIGVVFVFLLVSIICSAIREGLEGWMRTRAAYLERGIRELLHDRPAAPGGLARAFYEHPLIYSLYASEYTPGTDTGRRPLFVRGHELPSYIPAKNFALALMDITVRGRSTDAVSGDPDAPALTLDALRQNVRNVGNPAVQRVLLTAIDSAQGDLGRAQKAIEAWFDSGMDRVSGWYKRATHWIIFWVGLFVAVALNVDAIAIARFLYRDDAARAAIVARAQRVAGDTAYLSRTYQDARADLASLRLPIGWPMHRETVTIGGRTVVAGTPSDTTGVTPVVSAVRVQSATTVPAVLSAIPGWLITALAATFGAPFWFDILNKVMVIRSTVKPHEKSREESSEDRQQPKARVVERVADAPARTVRRVRGPGAVGASAPGAPAVAVLTPSPRDATSDEDGCDVDLQSDETPDEELPAAEGGVA